MFLLKVLFRIFADVFLSILLDFFMLRIQTPSLLVEDALSRSPVTDDDVRIALELSGVQPGVGEHLYYAPDGLSPELAQAITPMRQRVASVLDNMGFSVLLAPQPDSRVVKPGVWYALSDRDIVFKHTAGFSPFRFDVPDHPHLTAERIFPLRDVNGKLLNQALSIAPAMHDVPTLADAHFELPLRLRLRVLLDAMKGSSSGLSPLGVRHGDVKPDNVFVLPHSRQEVTGKLFDFEGVTPLSRDSLPVFSRLYSPSPYFGSHVPRLKLAGDTFSYGISLLEVLTSDDNVIALYKSWGKRRGVIEKFAPLDTPPLKMLELYYRGFSRLLHDFCQQNRISGRIEEMILQMLDPRPEVTAPSLNSVIRIVQVEYRLP